MKDYRSIVGLERSQNTDPDQLQQKIIFIHIFYPCHHPQRALFILKPWACWEDHKGTASGRA